MQHPIMFALLAGTLLSSISTSNAQTHLVGQEFDDYFNYFNERSQVLNLYTNRAQLYVFSESAPVHASPCAGAPVLTELPIGATIENVIDEKVMPVQDIINGYEDIWYKVAFYLSDNTREIGYIWGGDIARGWDIDDLTEDGTAELVMLGVSSRQRTAPKEIEAEVRIIRFGQLWKQAFIPGLCVFEACKSSPLLRVLRDTPHSGSSVIEASTFATGCVTGIDRTYLYWNGEDMERVWQAEMTTAQEFANRVFQTVQHTEAEHRIFQCQYSHQNKVLDPVWECMEKKAPAPAKAPPAKVARQARA